jgi:hypothetical protein
MTRPTGLAPHVTLATFDTEVTGQMIDLLDCLKHQVARTAKVKTHRIALPSGSFIIMYLYHVSSVSVDDAEMSLPCRLLKASQKF